jgi:hypothetical protein
MVSAAEGRLGIKFPEDYARFLCTINGGIPHPNGFMVPGCGEALADFLYGLSDERSRGDLEFQQELPTDFQQLPAGWLVIGHDPGGNSLILATAGEERGRVFYWDSAGFWASDDGENTFSLASSFTEFVESLRALA